MTPATKATHQLTKQHNRNLVLRTIFAHPTISRAAIARITQLTRSTVSEVVSGLIAEGLVQEMGPGSSTGGKPSILLGLVADSRFLIGVNLAQNEFIGSIINLRGEIKETVDIQVRVGDGEKAIGRVYLILDQLLRGAWQPVVGIGVGTPGLVNTRTGVVVDAVNLAWQNLPLAALLEQRYGFPVRLLNDSQATAIGEFVHGDHRSDGNLIVINAGHGIGAGILINGRLFQGDGGGAGEIGHVLVEAGETENRPVCRCGRRGCLESLASGRAILQAVQQLNGSPRLPSLDAVERKFYLGDPNIKGIVLQAGYHLGRFLGSLIGTLHMKKIILTGDVTRFGEEWLDAVRKAMSQAALGRMVQETELGLGKLGYRACLLGSSAYLLLDDYSLLFLQKEN